MKAYLRILWAVEVIAVSAFAQAPPPQAKPITPSPELIHQKLGVFVYPAKQQPAELQAKDETECYQWAQSQTAIDPFAAPAAAQQPQTEDASNAGKGARVKGAAGGAAGGAAIGAIAGDAGKGAATGAVVGTMAGGAKKRRAKREAQKQEQQAEEQAKQQATAQEQQRIGTFKKAYAACVSGRGYTVQ
jgi:hypothetical protein